MVDGLYVKALTGQGIHPAQTGSLLSGAHISKGAIIHSGISIDQMIANRVGEDTPQSSIVLACEQPMTGYHESGLFRGDDTYHQDSSFLSDSSCFSSCATTSAMKGSGFGGTVGSEGMLTMLF